MSDCSPRRFKKSINQTIIDCASHHQRELRLAREQIRSLEQSVLDMEKQIKILTDDKVRLLDAAHDGLAILNTISMRNADYPESRAYTEVQPMRSKLCFAVSLAELQVFGGSCPDMDKALELVALEKEARDAI